MKMNLANEFEMKNWEIDFMNKAIKQYFVNEHKTIPMNDFELHKNLS
jgi:hypothetical protein